MSTFKFDFFDNTEKTLAEDASAPTESTRVAEQFGEAIVSIGTDLTGFGAATTKTVFKKGEIVHINWTKSTAHVLFVHRISDGAVGDLPPAHVQLLQTHKDIETKSLFQSETTPLVVHHDAIWNSANKIAKQPSLSMAPLILEPGLDSLAWPLSTKEFLDSVYQKKVWVCHAASHRLESLRNDFCNFNPYELIHNSSRVVVWMKDKKSGRMQYLDAPPEVATACYSAGHSLYFNPPVEIQRKYISELANDLGLDFGATLGCADEEECFGGDIEVFAVSGKHVTPWHWDAQENFTVQLTGTKRWSVRAADIPHVLTNLHPSSSNQNGKREDMKVHRTCTNNEITQPIEGYWGPEHGVYTFLLRPGSVMYLPAGIWHRVEAEDEEGSLSINFSMGGARWADFFQRRVATLLWKDPRWRERIHVKSPSAAREHLRQLLQTLPGLLSNVTPEDLLPDGIFGANTASRVVEVEGDMGKYASEGNGSENISGTKRARDNATSGDVLAEGGDMDAHQRASAIEAGYEQGSELRITKESRFTRSRLVVLVIDNEWMPKHKKDTDGTLDVKKGISSNPLALVNCSDVFQVFLHSGFGSAGGEGTFRSDFSVTVRLPTEVIEVVRYLVNVHAGEEVSVAQILSKYASNEGISAGNQDALPDLLLRLLRVLCHNGYLLIKK